LHLLRHPYEFIVANFSFNTTIMKLKIYTFIFTVTLFVISGVAYAQTAEQQYKLDDGTVLTKTQVDSLSNLYEDKLKFTYKKEGDKLIVQITLPEEKAPIKATESTNTTFGSSQPAKTVYLDTLENEISLEDFRTLIREMEVGMHYKQEERNGQKVMIMRPATNKIAAEDLATIESKKKESLKWQDEKFPFETMTTLDGVSYQPSDFEGKIVLLNYWYVGCIPCIREMPELNKLVQDFAHRDDILFIAPSLSNADKIKDMLNDRAFDYSLIADAGSHNQKLGIIGYPTNMVVDRTGKVRFVTIGYEEDTVENMRAVLNNLIN